ncbi:1-aminocyclopropane-1-carboxylate deaminase/D-cysteine desulfhydrase [Streptomyces sp. NRRL F-5126]|uniref:1-aminocyclopropane-1-carboxylate deaminase/D-cysteine desulfhydrase n=1 Tax=Streptomyces sp. NRRL F-5126 TaxID=1463857 RepID=UPI003B63D0D4
MTPNDPAAPEPAGGRASRTSAPHPPSPLPPSPLVPSPLVPVADGRFTARGVRLLLKRDDLIHPDMPGNKWRKLAPNLSAARAEGADTLVTFGGAYSNHLRATAAAGRLLGLATVGVVRGDELARRPLNPSLARCAADGMVLRFTDRATYRRKAEPGILAALLHDARAGAGRALGRVYVVPEGGSNAAAVRGCVELGRELCDEADVVAVAVGTGGTLAGLAAGLPPGRRALGVAALRGGFLGREVRRLQRDAFGGERGAWSVDDRFHCGGFARSTPELAAFAAAFEEEHGISLERTYVAKLLYGLTAMVTAGEFAPGTSVAAVVTGPPDPV